MKEEIQTDCLRDYERLKNKINMFLSEVNELSNSDTEFITAYNKLKTLYLGNV